MKSKSNSIEKKDKRNEGAKESAAMPKTRAGVFTLIMYNFSVSRHGGIHNEWSEQKRRASVLWRQRK